MIHGLDTGFLVALEQLAHPEHRAARGTLRRLFAAGDGYAIAPQVLSEFIHVITDRQRFATPFDMKAATQAAQQWWNAKEAVHVASDVAAVDQFLAWMQQHSLGRKRVLDTLLAATFHRAGIQSIL